MKAFYTLILILMAGTAYGRDGFPECTSQYLDEVSRKYRLNCYGYSNSDWPEEFYEGELYAGVLNGQGVKVFQNGDIKIGQWKSGSLNGLGIFYSKDKKILAEGLWEYGQLIETKKLDPYKFTHIERSTLKKLGITYPAGEVVNENLTTQNGQSNLPACQGSDIPKWSNCYGSWISPHYEKYVGEWKDGKQSGQGTSTFGMGHYKYIGEFKEGKRDGQGTFIFSNGDKHVGDWKEGNLNGQGIQYRANGSIKESGVYKDGTLITYQYVDPNSFTRIAKNTNAPAITSTQRQELDQAKTQLELERQRLVEERRRLEEDKRQRELAKQSSRISITASATQPDTSGVVTITIQTNTDTSSLKINGEELGGKPDGSYSVKRVARVGQETKFILAATDVYGNTDTKSITVTRQAVDPKAVFGQLNAANVKQQPTRDAVAIIIGIEKYKRVAKADFANADAQDFYDYANRALGIKPENIKLLLDEGADDVEIYKAFQNWLPVKVKKGKTDVYVFYSGHGYPGQDGNSLYILPHGADKDLISKTAINQQEIVSAIQNAQPRTVTMFLDSCYSGQTRGGDVLIAGARPIAPKTSTNSYPPNFTVISASSNDQISSASPELKHGIFSYFLMKGMEGDADQNKDGKITVAEMQDYLTDMVGRQAMGMNRKQQPQLFGDADRVLVGR